jgi:tRNA-specific 2-thiouridylase
MSSFNEGFMYRKKGKIAVGMSGGVDSTVTALLMKQSGYDVVGVTMKIWKGESHSAIKRSGCYGPGEQKDIESAATAADQIGISHHVVDLTEEYQDGVLKHFRESYIKGKTPNPCVVCNAKIKFGLLLDKAISSGIDFDYFATGHYARIEFEENRGLYLLQTGVDKLKDQSYFLYRLKQSQLKKIIFPLGEKAKEEVKEIARQNGFASYADKEESQNFVECDSYASLLPPGDSGKIIDPSGRVLGNHKGIVSYTVGQRRNLRIGGLKEPYYVLKIDAKKNIVIAGPKELAFSKEVNVRDINWIVPFESITTEKIGVKIRYGMTPADCSFVSKKRDEVILDFKQPQFAVTPGQSAVFYDGEKVLGGGVIE